jgi:hypothetical protein
VIYVPYDPSLETPDEGGIDGPAARVQSVRESSPAECSLPFPSRRILLQLQLRPQRCDLLATGGGPDVRLVHSVNRLGHLKASVSSPPGHVELAKPQMF